MDNSSFLLDKIYGAWIGKIAGGTYAMPVEGRRKAHIQKLNPPLSGWIEKHRQIVNDDEQYELIALIALEGCSDTELEDRFHKQTLLSPEHQGPYWAANLKPLLVFTAEKAALDNATKYNVPWSNAADEIYKNRYQNPYFDWIGAQMKGEVFGMLTPAWGWRDQSHNLDSDVKSLRRVMDLAYQDAHLAHRGIAIVGELFVAALIAVGITYIPEHNRILVKYPPTCYRWLEDKFLSEIAQASGSKDEEIDLTGITAEIIKNDIRRIERVLEKYDNVDPPDVHTYFRFINPILEAHDANPDPRAWPEAWKKVDVEARKYKKELKADAIKRLKDHKSWKQIRLGVISILFGVHTIPNNSFIVIGLIYGDGDFSQTVMKATECGLDTDCNASNAAAILGSYLGNKLIPFYMKRLIRGELLPALTNWKEKSIYRLTERTITQTNRIANIK